MTSTRIKQKLLWQMAFLYVILSSATTYVMSQAAPEAPQPGDVLNSEDIPPCYSCCAKGKMGYPGLPGHPGLPGPQGYHGFPGSDGREGIQGPQGDRGFKGEHGDIGEKGRMGDLGPRGPGIGTKGDKGQPGDKGYIGITGVKGPPGPIGTPAFAGDKGQKGQKGSAEVSVRSFFSASRKNSKVFGPKNTFTITYNTLHVNEGSDMDKSTGKFKAPSNGLYFFAATIYKASKLPEFSAFLMVDNRKMAILTGGELNKDDSSTATVVLRLLKNEQVYLTLENGSQVTTTTYQEVVFCGYLITV